MMLNASTSRGWRQQRHRGQGQTPAEDELEHAILTRDPAGLVSGGISLQRRRTVNAPSLHRQRER
eukprot:2517599-Pyramimonas_sp.AAC.1